MMGRFAFASSGRRTRVSPSQDDVVPQSSVGVCIGDVCTNVYECVVVYGHQNGRPTEMKRLECDADWA